MAERKNKKVLMFGWEFPPVISGGLGTACHGLTKALAKKGESITFVIPYSEEIRTHVKLIGAEQYGMPSINTISIRSTLTPYITSAEYSKRHQKMGKSCENNIYSSNLYAEVLRYSEVAAKIAESEEHDIIHAHDWLTYLAGIKAKKKSGKPLVAHIHNTVFDRTGGHNISEFEYNIEKLGFEQADKIIAVSQYTKNMVISKYGINPLKIEVVHNGVEHDDVNDDTINDILTKENKIVLFLGRITLQKGPEYLLYSAKKVLEKVPNAKFVYAGSGDMEPFIIEKAAELGLSKNVLFAGFLKGKEIDKAYKMADVYVMPSVSEPFGITPLEALKNGTPVIISKQSGVSEVINHALKVDFWDIDELANKIIAVLQYSPLKEELSENGYNEVKKITWDNAAEKVIKIYDSLNQERC